MLLSLPGRLLRMAVAIVLCACALTGFAPAATGNAQAAGTGAVLYAANWSGGFGGWTTNYKKPLQGTGWHVAGGQLLSDGGNSAYARAPYEPGLHKIADYAVETQIRVLRINTALGAPHAFGQRARGQGLENNYGYQAWIIADQTPIPRLENLGGVSSSMLVNKQFVQFDPSVWHIYRQEVVGTQIRYLIDGVVVLKATDAGWKDGGWVGLFATGTQIAVRSFTVRALSSPSQAYAPACGTRCGAGSVLYQTTWSQGAHSLLDWSAPVGDPKQWDLRGGMLVTDGGSGGLVRPDFAPGDFGVSDYAVEAQIRLLGVAAVTNPSFGLRTRGQGIENNYGFEGGLTAPAHNGISTAIFDVGGGNYLGGKQFVLFDPTIWHTYRLAVAGKDVEYLVDGVPVAAGTSEAWKFGGFGGIRFGGSKIAVRSFTIVSLSGTSLPAVAPCTPHCGTGGAQYALPSSSFSAHNLLDWELIGGAYNSWHLEGGTLVGSNDGGTSTIKPDYEPGAWNRADYAVQADFQVRHVPQGGSPSYGLIAHGQGSERNYGYAAALVFNGSTWDAVIWNRSGGQDARKDAFARFALGSWHIMRIEVRGSQLRMLVDGAQVLVATDAQWKYGGWAAAYYSGPQVAIRDFMIQ